MQEILFLWLKFYFFPFPIEDDPLLFGLLPFQLAFSPSSLRWGLGAHNVCFKKPSHGTFCALSKIIPVIRGDGVYQRGVDMILEKMDKGKLFDTLITLPFVQEPS